MSDRQWYYRTGDGRGGPVTGDELRQLVAKRELRPSDHVRPEGRPVWVPATQVRGLFATQPTSPIGGAAPAAAEGVSRPESPLDQPKPHAQTDPPQEEDDLAALVAASVEEEDDPAAAPGQTIEESDTDDDAAIAVATAFLDEPGEEDAGPARERRATRAARSQQSAGPFGRLRRLFSIGL